MKIVRTEIEEIEREEEEEEVVVAVAVDNDGDGDVRKIRARVCVRVPQAAQRTQHITFFSFAIIFFLTFFSFFLIWNLCGFLYARSYIAAPSLTEKLTPTKII